MSKRITFVVFCSLALASAAQAAVITASAVMQRSDPSSSESGPWRFNDPEGAVLDATHHRLFVKDEKNQRVLVFPLDADNHIATSVPSYVLGQNAIGSSQDPAIGPSTLSGFTAGGDYDPVNDRLFISDSGNYRVLIFDVSPSAIHNGESASYVLGQDNFTSATSSIAANRFAHPDDVAYDAVGERLFVSDEFGARVLVFDVSTSTVRNGESASYVLGQADFTSRFATTTQDHMMGPTGEAYDPVNSRLFVSDFYASRVLVFDASTSTIHNGESAAYVLGQPDFTSAAPAAAQDHLSAADDLAYDPTNSRLFVNGFKASPRIVIFDVSPSVIHNGEKAENVLGQDTYTSAAPGATQSRFKTALGGPTYDPFNNRIFITDSADNRIMEFSMIHIITPSLPDGVVGVPYSAPVKTISAQGASQSWSVYKGQLPDGLELSTSTGVISGVPTSATTSSFTIEADDNFPTGPFFDRSKYQLTIFSTPPGSPGTASALQAFLYFMQPWKIQPPATQDMSQP